MYYKLLIKKINLFSNIRKYSKKEFDQIVKKIIKLQIHENEIALIIDQNHEWISINKSISKNASISLK